MQNICSKIKSSVDKNRLDLFYTVAFGLTIVAVIWITLLSRQPEQRTVYLIPLWSYRRALSGHWISLVDNLCNVLMFVPIGFFLTIVFGTGQIQTLIIGFLISLLIETSQIVFALGSFEVDDLINNSLGAYIGYTIFSRRNLEISGFGIKDNLKLTSATVLICTVLLASFQWASEYSLHQRMIQFAALNDREGMRNLLILDGKNGHTWNSGVHVNYNSDGSISIFGQSDIRSWFVLGTQSLDEGNYILTGFSGVEPRTVAIEIAFYDEEQGSYEQAVMDLGPYGDVEFHLVSPTKVRTYVSVYPECDCDVIVRPAIYKEGV